MPPKKINSEYLKTKPKRHNAQIFCYAKIMDSLRKLVNFGKKLSILPFYTFFFKKDLLETETVIKFASQKEIILHFSIQILFIKFKSPRFVRIRAFFLPPSQANKPTSQRANEPTSFRRSDEAEESVWVRFGSVWVRRVRLRELKADLIH